ncbi:MAG: hypothetical protein J6A45_05740 [Lachnospiraceae bacterium]|nr:hypothetical protein [Lachnospiraceae bacterium]
MASPHGLHAARRSSATSCSTENTKTGTQNYADTGGHTIQVHGKSQRTSLINKKYLNKEREFVMKRTKKILVTLFCAVLLVTGTVAVTVAYLTASTEIVNNTFSVGSVAITLDEAKVDVYGDAITGVARVKTNAYKLVPGHEYTKDPTVHVTAGSEPCWLFVKVENGLAGIEADSNDEPTIAAQMTAKDWVQLVIDDNGTEKTIENVYFYNGIVDARNGAIDKIVFEEFTLGDNVDLTGYGNATIKIDAYAVQADGFGTAAEAWESASTDWGN